MSYFKMIVSGGENPIQLDKDISEVDVTLDTINNDVMSRSNGVLAKLCVKGSIDETNSGPFLELFRWATDFNSETQYRKVEVYLYTGSNETGGYRRYEFGKMFVVDYQEVYTSSQDNNQYGSFELYLTQKDDNWDSVESFPS